MNLKYVFLNFGSDILMRWLWYKNFENQICLSPRRATLNGRKEIQDQLTCSRQIRLDVKTISGKTARPKRPIV